MQLFDCNNFDLQAAAQKHHTLDSASSACFGVVFGCGTQRRLTMCLMSHQPFVTVFSSVQHQLTKLTISCNGNTNFRDEIESETLLFSII